MRRVGIIGSPGAGKTTFAKKLALKLNLPLYHLDYYYHDSHFDYYNGKHAWRQKVSELAANPKWIIDGNYKSTFDIRFKQADTIIFLDYPRRTTLTRALLRRIKLHGKLRSDMPPNWREKFTLELLKFIWSYNKIERPKLHKVLSEESASKDIIIFNNSRQADLYLENI